jgi:hypothetical protein
VTVAKDLDWLVSSIQGAVAPQVAGPVFHGAVDAIHVPPVITVTRVQDGWIAVLYSNEQESKGIRGSSGALGSWEHPLWVVAMSV